MRFLYSLLVYLAAPLISCAFLWRGLRDRSYWHNFRERFGFGASLSTSGIWVHAVSVGEVQAAAPLVNALRQSHPDIPVTVTTFTPTGAARARLLFRDTVHVRYLPYDLPGAVRRFLKRVRPRLVVIFETELWPNLYHEIGRRRVPLVIASARLSPRSVGRYRRLGALFQRTLSQASVVAAQGDVDADRFRALGADPGSTHVTGNLKFDFAIPAEVAGRGRQLRELYAADRPVWVAGSTHGAGEEETILEAHSQVCRFNPGTLLVLVPRHPNRFDEVADLLSRRGIRFVRRSRGVAAGEVASAEVLLVDTLGELLDFYAAADVAFVGGSLVPVGGHNLLEPAALGLPILTGPNNFNGPDIFRQLTQCAAVQVVGDAQQLAEAVAKLLGDAALRARLGGQGREFVAANRGALAKLLALVEPLLTGNGHRTAVSADQARV